MSSSSPSTPSTTTPDSILHDPSGLLKENVFEEIEPETALPEVNATNEPRPELPKRSKRLIDRFVLAREVEDPKSYSRPFKWLITSLVAAAATLDFMGATILYRKEDLHCYSH